MATFGSARIDERGKATGGQPGDQKQVSMPDTKGEVAMQPFYVSKQGWIILRAKNPEHRKRIAVAMITACNNANIGYSQGDRYGIIKYGTASTVKTNSDCSSLVRQCVKEATGKDPGDFNTAAEANVLMKTGLFDRSEYSQGVTLLTGDILVTKTKGHTGVITEGDQKKSVHEIAIEVMNGLWGSGQDRKNRLHAAGYDYAEVQAEVNRLSTAQHTGEKGLELIKHYESCRLKAYKLAGEKYYTIGWGHHGADVLPNMTISQQRADELLRLDLQATERYVKKYVTDITLTQNRFDALVSYTYNRGPKGLQQLANNCHTVNEYADGLVKYWGSAERYMAALVNRRQKERELFLS